MVMNKMSITRSASARTQEWEEQVAEADKKETEVEKRTAESGETKLNRLERSIDKDLVNQSPELTELYEYYKVTAYCNV